MVYITQVFYKSGDSSSAVFMEGCRGLYFSHIGANFLCSVNVMSLEKSVLLVIEEGVPSNFSSIAITRN